MFGIVNVVFGYIEVCSVYRSFRRTLKKIKSHYGNRKKPFVGHFNVVMTLQA